METRAPLVGAATARCPLCRGVGWLLLHRRAGEGSSTGPESRAGVPRTCALPPPGTSERAALAAILLGCALLASGRGQHLRAATLHAAADTAIQRLDLSFQPLEAGMRRDDHQRLRATLGDSAFDVAYEQGHDLTLAAALTMASETASSDVPDQ